jgi:prevent-host-death family protein
MKSIGLFEAKSKFSEICDTVARTGRPVQVTRRGSPIAIISKWQSPKDSASVWERRKEFERRHGPLDEDFDLPPRRIDPSRDFLD